MIDKRTVLKRLRAVSIVGMFALLIGWYYLRYVSHELTIMNQFHIGVPILTFIVLWLYLDCELMKLEIDELKGEKK